MEQERLKALSVLLDNALKEGDFKHEDKFFLFHARKIIEEKITTKEERIKKAVDAIRLSPDYDRSNLHGPSCTD